ncbi:MAG: hypothetical protein R3301_01840 [Saprospiraceae bacterium]|nr:hypothetical protein [Saprospiraceae bacterium]
MKASFVVATLFLFSTAVGAVGSHPAASAPTVLGMQMDGMAGLTADDLIAHKPRELAKKYGVKLKFKQRLALSVVRGKLKKAKRKGHDLNTAFDDASGSSSFHFGGFILGFFLGLLGWLLAILIWPNMGAGRSALLGFAIWLIVLILII